MVIEGIERIKEIREGCMLLVTIKGERERDRHRERGGGREREREREFLVLQRYRSVKGGMVWTISGRGGGLLG